MKMLFDQRNEVVYHHVDFQKILGGDYSVCLRVVLENTSTVTTTRMHEVLELSLHHR